MRLENIRDSAQTQLTRVGIDESSFRRGKIAGKTGLENPNFDTVEESQVAWECRMLEWGGQRAEVTGRIKTKIPSRQNGNGW